MAKTSKTNRNRRASLSVPGLKVKTTAVINQLSVGCHKDKISFKAISLTGDDNKVITDMVKNERDVLMTIDLPKPDKNFPPIQVKGKLKGYKISKTCDSPDVINVQFGSGQVEQLTNYIRSEEQISLVFLECEPELNFESEDEKTET